MINFQGNIQKTYCYVDEQGCVYSPDKSNKETSKDVDATILANLGDVLKSDAFASNIKLSGQPERDVLQVGVNAENKLELVLQTPANPHQLEMEYTSDPLDGDQKASIMSMIAEKVETQTPVRLTQELASGLLKKLGF